MAKPVGQPTKYDDTLPERALAFMREGFSKTATAGHLGICRSTFDNWTKANAEFLDAIKRGEAARVAFLEASLLAAPDGPTVTSRIFALKNAAPDEWRDKREVENKTEVSAKGDGLERLRPFLGDGDDD